MARLTLIASGTRGDVQPYIALGLGLQAAGQTVRVVAPAAFQPWVTQAGLTCVAVSGNPSDLLVQEPDALRWQRNPIAALQAALRFHRRAVPLYERLLAETWTACQGSDVLVFGVAATWAAHLAEAMACSTVWALLQPFGRTAEYPSALLPFRRSFGHAYHLATHTLIEQLMWQPWRGVINTWRRQHGLHPLPVRWDDTALKSALALHGYSAHIAPRPSDWPAQHVITGYWRTKAGDAGPQWCAPKALADFMDARRDRPLISIGFGGTGLQDAAHTLAEVKRAVQEAGVRAVFIGPGEWHAQFADLADVFPVEAVPHEWLFAQVDAAVHHAGAGTTAASLRAGLPTLGLPQAVDQFFWAERVHALGAGPRPMPQRQINAERLAQSLRDLVSEARYRARARALSQDLNHEDGVGRAVALIETNVLRPL